MKTIIWTLDSVDEEPQEKDSQDQTEKNKMVMGAEIEVENEEVSIWTLE